MTFKFDLPPLPPLHTEADLRPIREWLEKVREHEMRLFARLAPLLQVSTGGVDHGSLVGLTDADHVAGSIAFTATDRLLGRDTAAAGAGEELTVGGGLEFTGSGGIQRSALTGDVRVTAGLATTVIQADVVLDTMLRNSAAVSVIGRAANSSGDPADIAAGSNNTVFGRRSNALTFAAVDLTAEVTGTLPIANGGTGATAARNVVNTVTFFSGPASAITLTDQAVAATFFVNSNRNIWRVDLTGYAECRINVRVTVGSASANTPRIRLRYFTSFSTTLSDYLDIGTSEVAASLTSAGLSTSGWIALAAGAKADVFISCEPIGGDAAADPVVSSVFGEFRIPV